MSDEVIATCKGCTLTISGRPYHVVALMTIHGSSTAHDLSLERKETYREGSEEAEAKLSSASTTPHGQKSKAEASS